ncbi:beta-N-acetylhexosaminidase [Haloferula luteola]|uniref:beta-N-acetylhexosaminidase n=1 Tax=Haloferula luteola TaxID=595692 RepID=A0A840V3Q3_9BACT|nr:beta-N-acetylhexosaminidase [Haloferula luteola]MBB5352612.1 beta-N-acetylhexosaminidase [Haloferula luteola]
MTPFILGIASTTLNNEEISLFTDLQPAGYILFSRNLESPVQARELTDHLRSLHPDPPLIAIDQEGGHVTRTAAFAPAPPSAAEFAAFESPERPAAIANAAAHTADLLRLMGINWNFAPVLDLDHHPEANNSLSSRCWGRDPQRVIDHAGQWNRWLRKRGLKSCAKHFPACGRATSDPHFDLPRSEATIEDFLKEDVLPYTALMPELDSIMLAHVLFPRVDPELPSSLSPTLIQGFLRGQLGFDHHLVLTDDLDMGAIADRFPDNTDVTAALEAGNDLALICHRIGRVRDAAARVAQLSPDLLAESEKRLHRFRKGLTSPLTWKDEAWEKTCSALADIRAQVPTLTDLKGESPVTTY